MKVRIFLIFLVLLTGAYAQEMLVEEQINEEQILLDGYVDNSGKVLLTGYATPESLPYIPFLNNTQYTFNNNTNQLYVVTDMLTSKSGDAWSLNFSLDGYYSDYSVTFYLPPGSEITRFDIQPGLNYQLHVKEDFLILSTQGYRVVSPWIKVHYKLSTNLQGESSVPYILLIILLIAGATYAYYRYKINKGTRIYGKKEAEIELSPGSEAIHISSNMQKVMDTLSEKEKAIVGLLLRKGGSAMQSEIRFETRIPKSSLTGILNALKRKNIIKKHEHGRTNLIELSEWFLS